MSLGEATGNWMNCLSAESRRESSRVLNVQAIMASRTASLLELELFCIFASAQYAKVARFRR